MWGTVLWLVVLVALSVAAAIVLRRVGSLAGSTHELERLQSDVRGIDTRLAGIVDPLVVDLDGLRRGAVDPATVATEVEAARSALRSLAAEAHALQSPDPLAGRTAQLAGEVDRAVRAADLVGHGTRGLGSRRDAFGQESQVALKRGTLGLRHAREAVARIAAGMSALTPAEVQAMPPPRPGDAIVVTTAVVPPEDELPVGEADNETSPG